MSRPTLIRLAIIGGALVAWELVRWSGLVSPIVLAAPSDILAAFQKSGGEFLQAFQVTLFEIAVSLLICWVVGISFGLLAGSVPILGMTAGPILASLFAIPLIVWYPLFMVWLGIGPASKIMFAVVSGVFPIAINTMNGVRQLDRKYLLLGRSLGATRAQMAIRIMLPLALPSVMSGLRIGSALAVIGVIVAEMLASLQGIGFWITYHRTLFNTGHVYLGILLALTCALLVNWGLSRLERRFGQWQDLEKTES